MTSTESYTAVASKAREATEKSVEAWKQGAKTFTDQANVVAKLPTVDLTQPVDRYFEYVQKSVDLNRDLATRWAELVTSMTGTVREQAEKVSSIVKDQTDNVADVATEQAKKAEEVAQEQAELAEKAEKEQAAAGPSGRARRGQGSPREGPRAVRGADQGRAVRPARRAWPAEVGQRRGAHRAAGERRQRVMSDAAGTSWSRRIHDCTEPVHDAGAGAALPAPASCVVFPPRGVSSVASPATARRRRRRPPDLGDPHARPAGHLDRRQPARTARRTAPVLLPGRHG